MFFRWSDQFRQSDGNAFIYFAFLNQDIKHLKGLRANGKNQHELIATKNCLRSGKLPDDRCAARQSETKFKDIGTGIKNFSDHVKTEYHHPRGPAWANRVPLRSPRHSVCKNLRNPLIPA